MNPPPQPSRMDRWHQRLTQSKYWSISLAVHAVLLATLSTIVLVQRTPVDDFTLVGIPDSTDGSDEPLKRDDERPTEIAIDQTARPESTSLPSQPDLMEKQTTFRPALPTVHVPIPTKFEAPPAGGDPGNELDQPKRAPAFVPKELGGRFAHGLDGRIKVSGPPGRGPQPTPQTEDAVLRGLKWLRENQNEDGSWGQKTKGAMTGLALLAFLGHGETDQSPNYGLAVRKAIDWVVENGTKHQGRLSMTEGDWGPGNGGVYEHGILTYALGEYYLLTEDQRVTELFRQAVGRIVDGQGPDGGWMYHYDKTQSDTSVSGWQVQALKVAHMTKLNIPKVNSALDRAMANFDRVQGPKGGYGYRTPGDRYSLSGVGILCELFWKEKRDASMRDGVDFILEHTKSEPVEYEHEKADLYAWYYHTQAMLMFGGSAWVNWEKKFRSMSLKSQAPDGSWPVMKNAGHGNLQNDPSVTGGVYRTALNVLMLESYYRYLGLNQANMSSDGLKLAVR